MRTTASLAALLALTGALGCEATLTRVLSVTVLDSAEVACEPAASGPIVNETRIKDFAEAQERAIKRAAITYPLTPLGRTLHVVEVDRMQAWFEAPDNNFGALNSALRLDTNEVYGGPVRDEYVEGAYEDLRDTCPFVASPEDPCGVIPVLRAELTLTIDSDGALGRIRLVESFYDNTDEGNPFDTRIECTRNLSLQGAENH